VKVFTILMEVIDLALRVAGLVTLLSLFTPQAEKATGATALLVRTIAM